MFLTGAESKYLPLMAELEARSYPEELTLGLDNIEEDSRKECFSLYSVCGFSNGKLVGYIMANRIGARGIELHIYISDLNCPNPKYLKRILLKFFSGYKYATYHADLRENSYRLLCNQQRKKSGMIQIVKDDYVPGYYDNGEAVHQVTFCVNTEGYLQDNWRDGFLNNLDNFSAVSNHDIMKYAIDYLKNWIGQVDFYDKRNMNFIIKSIKETILDYYKMFGDKIEGKFSYYLLTRAQKDKDNKTGFENLIAKLQQKGYKEGAEKNGYEYYPWYGRLYVSTSIEVFNTQYRDTLSGYRWLRKKQLKYVLSNDAMQNKWTSYVNKYDVSHHMIKVPYLTERQYLYYLNKVSFKKQIITEYQLESQDKLSFELFADEIYSLLRSKDAQMCINSIACRRKQNQANFFHDWELIVADLCRTKSILTDGAIKTILRGSYNQAVLICRDIMAIKQTVLDDSRLRKLFGINEIRKRISKLIRKQESCLPYIEGLTEHVNQIYSARLHIPASEKEKLPEYMKRLQKYRGTITIYTLYRLFGKDCFSKFLRGTYPCVFKPEILYPSYNVLAEFVMGVLKKKGTAQAKHVYGKLKREGLLLAVNTGDITLKQYHEILQILKRHNVKISDNMIKNLPDFKICIEPKGSPEYLTAGDASVCCMSLGTDKATIYAKEEGFGIINVYYRERVIANSVIWINEPHQCLVMDNIEVHPNYRKFSRQLELSFYTVAEYLMLQYGLQFVAQGINYNDLVLYQENAPTYHFEKLEPVGVHTQNFYTDALHFKIAMKKRQNDSPEELFGFGEERGAA